MKKTKKQSTVKGIVIGTILGTVLTGSIAVTAVTLTAKEIKYTPSTQISTATNAEDAINELYEMTVDLKGNIIYDVINLGNAREINITDIVGAENIDKYTVDDFICLTTYEPIGGIYIPAVSDHNYPTYVGTQNYVNITKSYSPSSGILTLTGGQCNFTVTMSENRGNYSNVITAPVVTYLKVKTPL